MIRDDPCERGATDSLAYRLRPWRARASVEMTMADVGGTRTHDNLETAFTREAQSSQRYLWFAQQAEIEGRPDVAALLREIALTESAHAQGLLEYLAEVGDPLSRTPIARADDFLRSALEVERTECLSLYGEYAVAARRDGLDEIADWFDTLVASARRHTEALERLLDGGG